MTNYRKNYVYTPKAQYSINGVLDKILLIYTLDAIGRRPEAQVGLQEGAPNASRNDAGAGARTGYAAPFRIVLGLGSWVLSIYILIW